MWEVTGYHKIQYVVSMGEETFVQKFIDLKLVCQMATHTNTHTHTQIYIYIYIYI